MKIGLMLKCLKILFSTKTIPKWNWIYLFFSVVLTVIQKPQMIFGQNYTSGGGKLLSDYFPQNIIVKNHKDISFIARPKFEDFARFLFSETLAKWEPLTLINLKENEVMIDIGANTGYYTLQLAKKFQASKIISIEADPQTCEILKNNCKLNYLTNVDILNKAVSDKKGQVEFFQRMQSGTSSIYSINSDEKKINIQTNTLDNILKEYQNISWIKVDVEGAELSVLRGATQVLKKTKNILIEVHEHVLTKNNENPQEIIHILKNNGFEIRLFPEFWNQQTSPNKALKSDYILAEKF